MNAIESSLEQKKLNFMNKQNSFTIDDIMLPFSNMNKRENRIFKALADPTRRRILDLLRESPKTTGELDSSFSRLSRCAVMKHLRILENAQLITVERKGKFRWNYLNSIPIQQIYNRWICNYTAPHAKRITNLKRQIENKEK